MPQLGLTGREATVKLVREPGKGKLIIIKEIIIKLDIMKTRMRIISFNEDNIKDFINTIYEKR